MYVFKLGGTAGKPVINFRKTPVPRPPAITVSAGEYIRGAQLYERNCTVCHGVAALSGGVLPDLRRSILIQDAVAFRRVVVDGERAPLGMPRFGKYVSAADAELIRAYVARQAKTAYDAERQMNAAATK